MDGMKFEAALTKARKWFSTPIAWVLLGGLVLRLYSAGMRTIINPDGAAYIFQASAIFNLQWSDLFACKLSHLSPLPFFIAAGYTICRDWVVAGQLVNVVFGWATLVPLYHITRRYFDRNISTLTVLVYALMPFLVDGSANVIRGPMFWFCLTMGMLFFLRQWDQEAADGRFRYDVLLATLFFLLATWCRIEGVVFLVAPIFYLVIAKTDHKLQRCTFLLMPMMLIALAGVSVSLWTGMDLYTVLKVKQVFREATQFITNYHAVEAWIRTEDHQDNILLREFLHRSRESLGLIPLVVIFQNVLEGVFYPFALIFFAGIFGIRQKCRQNPHMAYFLWQSLAGFLILYVHILQIWIVSYRFLAVLIFPGCVLMANGIDKTIHYFHGRRKWPLSKAIGWAAVMLIVFGLPKNLKPEEGDKIVYRQAAQVLAVQESAGQSANGIAGFMRSRALSWIQLYAHRDLGRMPCSRSLARLMTSDYRQFVANLDEAGIGYVLYEERFWPHDVLDLPSALLDKDFKLLGRWQHPDSKKFMLLQRTGS